jgi:geranylgeranyl diphosphate synthase, type II
MQKFDAPHFDTYVKARLQKINEALDRYTPSASTLPITLHEAMRYSLFAGGKRTRPLLCLAAAEAVGGDSDLVLPTACAIEMVHTFSLIHDDLPALDNDDLRRGMVTSHKKYGEAMAILAGDALHTLAFTIIAKHQMGEAAKIIRLLAMLGEACGEAGMVGGQVDDMFYEGRTDVTPEILQSIHARKTGALLVVSLIAGGILVGATEVQEQSLRVFGEEIGVAFQIMDDILDVTSTEEQMGKPVGSDLKNDKATYPKLFGMEESEQMLREHLQMGLGALEPLGSAADPLRAFAHFIVDRKH